MSEFRFQQISKRLDVLERDKTNICAFKSLMERVNYMETLINDLIPRVRRLEDEIQTANNESETIRERLDSMQKSLQKMGGVLKHDRGHE